MAKLSLPEVMYLRTMMREDYQRNQATFRWLSHFLSPNRLKESADDRSNKQARTRAIIRNKGGLSLRTFQSGMLAGATPRARPWFNLTVNNDSKANSTTAKRFFSQSEKIINSFFQIGNLYEVLPMAYKDIGVFSTAAYGMLPHVRYGFWFYPYAMGTYGFACDAENNANMFYRDVSMTVRQCVETYGGLTPSGHADVSKLPAYVQSMWNNKRYLERLVLSQVICPNNTFSPLKAKTSLDPLDKKFQCYTYVHSTGSNLPTQYATGTRNEASIDTGEYVKVSGYSYFPVIIPRWEVQPEGTWGCDGPGDIALGNVMSLNEMERFRLEAVAKLVKPPMVGHASLKRHQSSILAGGMTYVDDAGALAGFKPAFTVDPKLYELIQAGNEYIADIEEAFYVDLFRQFSRGESKTHVTVEEIREKSSERMAMVAPAIGQLDRDQNGKLIANAQIILEERGIMPPRPRDLEGEEMRPEYISILAQAAKVSMMNSVERGANFIGSFAQSMGKPEIARIINEEKYARSYLGYLAIDPELIRSEDEMEEIRQQMQAEQQQARSLQVQAQQAATAKDLSQAPVGQGSMLDTFLDASNG